MLTRSSTGGQRRGFRDARASPSDGALSIPAIDSRIHLAVSEKKESESSRERVFKKGDKHHVKGEE